jgi:hypothetical protein
MLRIKPLPNVDIEKLGSNPGSPYRLVARRRLTWPKQRFPVRSFRVCDPSPISPSLKRNSVLVRTANGSGGHEKVEALRPIPKRKLPDIAPKTSANRYHRLLHVDPFATSPHGSQPQRPVGPLGPVSPGGALSKLPMSAIVGPQSQELCIEV